jgi:hypothetical protein
VLGSRSRSASSAALVAPLLLLAACVTGVLCAPAGATAAVSPATTWSPLPALYEGGVSLDPGEAPGSFAAARAQEEGTATQASHGGPGKKALLYSLLLPGMGEMSMGHSGRAIPFFVAEGLIWANYAYWKVSGDMRQDNYIEQAQLNAGVGVSKESDDYWRLVGQFESSSGSGPGTYEEDLRREARDTYPNDPAAQDAFVAERLPTGDRAWDWSSAELQSSYQDMRENATRADNRAEYSFAAAILNRVVSVIDVQLLRRKAAKEGQSRLDAPQTRVYADTDADGYGRLVIARRF